MAAAAAAAGAQALIHGLNRHYYSIAIAFRKTELDEKMLMNLHSRRWTRGLSVAPFEAHAAETEKTLAVRGAAPLGGGGRPALARSRPGACRSRWRR